LHWKRQGSGDDDGKQNAHCGGLLD
jgi:hypothetical protein